VNPAVKLSLFLLLGLGFYVSACGQVRDTAVIRTKEVKRHQNFILPINKQVDMIGIVTHFIGRDSIRNRDSAVTDDHRLHFSAIPAVGYTLLTGFAGIGAANLVFNTGKSTQLNQSSILTSITYSQFRQVILPLQADIWSPNDKYNFQTDWRYLEYPSYTYGLGGFTKLKDAYAIYYNYLRFYQSISRSIGKNIYLGIGYDLDYLWNIEQLDPPVGVQTDFDQYGFYPIEKASGITLNLLYDTRGNPINPLGGGYAHLVYRTNFTFLGSSSNWQSVQVDLRKYFRLSKYNENVLALWSFDWFTLGGVPPYLLLPSTGWDPYNNTGRGYIQGRFRGKDMLYLESEFRFGITRNGFLGGVIFANAQSFSETNSGEFEVIAPGAGLGIRIRLNKFSRTNLALDYGFGIGSQGFAVNLGEVF